MLKRFQITGMTCAACKSAIENKLNKLDGVKQVNINLLTNNMEIMVEDYVTNQMISDTVIQLGYGILEEKAINLSENRFQKMKIIICVVLSILLMFVAMGPMFNIGFLKKFQNYDYGILFSFTQLVLTIPIIIVNFSTIIRGIKAILKFYPNMDSLIAIGVISAFLYSLYLIVINIINKTGIHHLYFESAGMILTIVLIGKTIEKRAKRQTTKTLEQLLNLLPKMANLINDQNIELVPVETLKVGDQVLVKAGDKIPLDGIVIKGDGYIDESTMTGESKPVHKENGSKVLASTINGKSPLVVEVKAVAGETLMDEIVRLVTNASSTKAPIEKLADRISRFFVPTIIVFALVVFGAWLLAGQNFSDAFSTLIAILVIACPCALGLATPTSIMVALGKGAEYGILIKDATILEKLHSVNLVVFDKTNTITQGKLEVIECVGKQDDKFDLIVKSLESFSEHPIATAILSYYQNNQNKNLEVDNLKIIPGIGISGSIDNQNYIIGSHRTIEQKKNNYQITTKGTTIYLSDDKQVLKIYVIKDQIKNDAQFALEKLNDLKISYALLTGDSIDNTKELNDLLHFSDINASVLPHQKDIVIQRYQSENKIVAMVGDGINDSIALTRADIGIAIGSGTDIAIDASDVVLVKDELIDVVNAILLSKATFKNIKQNLFWALIYNIIAVIFASGLYYILTNKPFNPMISALAMSLSSIFVVANALRLQKYKPIKMNGEKIIMQINIDGMTCNHCANRVKNAILSLDSNLNVEINLDQKLAIVTSQNKDQSIQLDNADIIKVINDAGYNVKSIQKKS